MRKGNNLSVGAKIIPLFLIFISLAPACSTSQVLPSDKNATKETINLYQNLFSLLNKGVMFGHQDDLAYGVGWRDKKKNSDVKTVTGSYPAVYGWDMGHLERDSMDNFDGVSFAKMADNIKRVYKRGGINTISWHMNDPVTDKTAWSTPPNTVRLILNDPKYKAIYIDWLAKLSFFIKKCQHKNKLIPIIYRPFHEQTGNWFWWGKTSCTAGEYKALWKLTVDYLRDEQHLHNLLFAYSTAGFKTESEFIERYPGDEYVDLIGTDIYCDSNITYFKEDIKRRLDIIEKVAIKHKKVPALTEVGYENVPQADWWTKVLMPAVAPYNLSYMLAWRNWKEEHFFVPYRGQLSEKDFVRFFNQPKTLFQKDIKSSIYKKKLY